MKNKNIATIITIGDELLIGQVVDTNSPWIAQQLNNIGIQVIQRIAIADDASTIISTLDNNILKNNLIILTGGLGPTSDDITKGVLVNYFNDTLELHQPSLDHIKKIFAQKNIDILLERNIQQACVPKKCTILFNKLGTAPGMLFTKNNCTIVSLPGVPNEMKSIFEEELLPVLQKQYVFNKVIHKTLITADIIESNISEILIDFEKNLPPFIKLAYLPNYVLVRLRLSCYEINEEKEIILNNKFVELQNLLKPYIISLEDIPLEKIIADKLTQKGLTISTAESCTGGYISHLLTKHPGSSKFFIGSIVCYNNDIKVSQLEVPKTLIETKGVVSIETVEIMAKSILKKFKSDYSIAISGILGPTGETPDKPIGMVCIAVADKNSIQSKTIYLKYNREKNIELTSMFTLNLLRKMIS